MITAQLESFTEQLPELKPLLPGHWAELALYQDKMPLDPDYGYYERLEVHGQLIFCTIRENGALVGYFVGILGPSPHYQSTPTCKMDVIYVHPDHRGQHAGRLLLDKVKAELVRRGIKCWWVGSKNHKPIEWLYEQYGFDRSEAYFSMWLGDSDAT